MSSPSGRVSVSEKGAALSTLWLICPWPSPMLEPFLGRADTELTGLLAKYSIRHLVTGSPSMDTAGEKGVFSTGPLCQGTMTEQGRGSARCPGSGLGEYAEDPWPQGLPRRAGERCFAGIKFC